MIEKLCLNLITDEAVIHQEKAGNLSLSLAMGIIAAYMEEHNIVTKINDLNRTAGGHIYNEEELELLQLVYNKQRIIKYIEGNSDGDLDAVALMFVNDDWKEYDAYGISIGADFSMFQIHLGFIMAAYYKNQTGKTVFIGGNNITYLYIFKDFFDEILQAVVGRFSYVIKGPGERTIWDIIKGLDEDPGYDAANVPGVLKIMDGEIIANKEYDPFVIAPSWESLNMEEYSYPYTNVRENQLTYYKFPMALTQKVIAFNKKTQQKKPIIPYIFNFNCVYNCAFCTQSDSERSGFIVEEVHKVVDDIEMLSKKYNSQFFYFLNNYFPSSMKFIQTFHDELKRRNLKIYWSDCGRVNGLTKEKLQLLKESGCLKLVFGFESGSKKILDLIDKRIDIAKVEQVLDWCHEVGIWADLEVIIGLPYEREAEFLETHDFIKSHMNRINYFWLNEYFVVPNSLIGKFPERYGVALRKGATTYKELLERNRRVFAAKGFIDNTSNARLWSYDEINEGDSRISQEMRQENKNKIGRLSQIRNPEFSQLFDFYTKLQKLKTIS